MGRCRFDLSPFDDGQAASCRPADVLLIDYDLYPPQESNPQSPDPLALGNDDGGGGDGGVDQQVVRVAPIYGSASAHAHGGVAEARRGT